MRRATNSRLCGKSRSLLSVSFSSVRSYWRSSAIEPQFQEGVKCAIPRLCDIHERAEVIFTRDREREIHRGERGNRRRSNLSFLELVNPSIFIETFERI